MPELLRLDAKGDLFRYTVRPGPRITDRTLIGVQFYDFRRLLSTGDYNGDGAPDVLAVGPRADLVVYFVKDGHWAGTELTRAGWRYRLTG